MMRIHKWASAGLVAVALAAVSQPAVSGPFVPGPIVVPTFPVTPKGYLPHPDLVPSKEYSNGNCETGALAGPAPPTGPCPNGTLGDRNTTGVAVSDPGQIIGWDGAKPGGVADWTDFSGTISGIEDQQMQIDGLSHRQDLFFREVENDSAYLLFSTDGDPDIYYETPGAAVGGVWATGQPAFVTGGPGNDIDQHGVYDVDALEIWGPFNPVEAADGDRFSLESGTHTGTADPAGVSVWDSPGPGGPATPFWFVSEIQAAILAASGILVEQSEIDLDAMMNFQGSLDLDHAAGTVDHLIFSIDPIIGSPFDGGEIFVAHRIGGPGTFGLAGGGTAHFLSHGGHVWDTAFDVMGTFGTASENINALEGAFINEEDVPEPATLALAGMALAGLGFAARRRN